MRVAGFIFYVVFFRFWFESFEGVKVEGYDMDYYALAPFL